MILGFHLVFPSLSIVSQCAQSLETRLSSVQGNHPSSSGPEEKHKAGGEMLEKTLHASSATRRPSMLLGQRWG